MESQLNPGINTVQVVKRMRAAYETPYSVVNFQSFVEVWTVRLVEQLARIWISGNKQQLYATTVYKNKGAHKHSSSTSLVIWTKVSREFITAMASGKRLSEKAFRYK